MFRGKNQAILQSSDKLIENSVDFEGQVMSDEVSTIFSSRIISYGYFSEKYGDTGHLGVDISFPPYTRFGATSAGKVMYTQGSGENKIIAIQTRDLLHIYGHIIPSITEGYVEAGQEIGIISPYSRPNSGPHIHFGMSRFTRHYENIVGGVGWGWGTTSDKVVANRTKENASKHGWVDPRFYIFSIGLTQGHNWAHTVANP